MISRLWQEAHQLAASLQDRDEVTGIGLYGSLSYDRVTPFSDLDIFIVTSEPEHSPGVEHRLHSGIRVDLMWETLDRWQKIQYASPRYMPWYLVKALLLGRDKAILYDPEGVIREKRDELRQEITYDRFMAQDMAWSLNEIIERVMIAIWQEEEGNFLEAWDDVSRWCTGYLFMILADLTNSKSIEEAAQAIGIPGLQDHIESIRHLKCTIDGLTPEYVSRIYEVDKAHWEYQLEHIWQPLKQHLMAQGVESPDDLTVSGELILPYGGVRLYELGRALFEHNFSLAWAESELERGDTLEALGKIRYEDIIDRADEKWMRVDYAITDAGYNTGTIIKDFLVSEEFRERTEAARKALDPPDAVPVTPEQAHQLNSAVYEYTRLLNEYLVSNYPDILEAMPDLYSLSRAEIVQRCRQREARIDSDIVFIIVSKERAAIQRLAFKPGTNADLVETHWTNAFLLDLSSMSHRELRKKWTLEKEETGSDEAHFVFFSQDGGYRVTMNITWSKAGVTVEDVFQLPHPISINNNIAIAGRKWPKSRNDCWATTIDGEVRVGRYTYQGGPHVFIHPPDGRYFTPEGCWIAAWNEDTDEVCGFTFFNCGCIISSGASTDFEFYLPEGESTLRFHVITPKPSPPYLALQQWACDERPAGLHLDDEGVFPRSPYASRKG